MSPLLLKLERAVANSISAREHRMRLETELATARNTEECRQHELQEALIQYRKSIAGEPMPIDAKRMLNTAFGPLSTSGSSGTPLTSDTASAILRTFDGIRD